MIKTHAGKAKIDEKVKDVPKSGNPKINWENTMGPK